MRILHLRLHATELLPLAFALACSAGNALAEVQFRCPAQLDSLQRETAEYLQTLNIPAALVAQTVDTKSGELTLALTTPADDTRTLDLHQRPEFALSTERVRLPSPKGGTRVLDIVSKKEIMLALLQHGRKTVFKEQSCSVEALSNHVGVRQNIVAWAEHLHLTWPNGDKAKWNERYWSRGTPKPGVSVHDALMDVFMHQRQYFIGCYTAAKLVMVQGTLDYYNRIKNDEERTRKVEETLLADGDPLVGIEPGQMWSFEKDFDAEQMGHKGKLLKLQTEVAAGNLIPGDWGYILNTDPVSAQKTGYEGSNAIYLGRNRLSDYYDDHNHSYTYEEKLDEVYQWRNGVFSRSRDANKIKPLTADELKKLGETPANGGLQLDIRAVPRNF
jgi:hypothetical protein